MTERLLDVKGLKTYFYTDEGIVRAVDGVDLYINKGETLGVVGESGSGKSVTALSVMRLIPQPPGRIVEGTIVYDGKKLLELPPAQMRKIRGKEISMIFQEPMTSLNPARSSRSASRSPRRSGSTRGSAAATRWRRPSRCSSSCTSRTPSAG